MPGAKARRDVGMREIEGRDRKKYICIGGDKPLKKVFRQVVAVALVVTLAMLSLCSCGKADVAISKEPPGTVISETAGEVTIVDQAGREVTVKKDPESIALCYRVVIRFLLSLDRGGNITGIGKTEEFLLELQPSLRDCVDVGQGVADIEALAELKPDLFIHKASDVETLEAVKKIGIPAVGIDVETPEDMMIALKILGKICAAEAKADELISYYNRQLKEIDELAEKIGEKGKTDKKTAIVMGSSIGKVADATMLQGEMLQRAGGINCAGDIEASELWPTAGTEQIFKWNPEYIFITGSESAVYDESDIISDSAWSEIEAVKNGNVYVMPATGDSWEFPGVVSILGIYYMMHSMYPQLVSEEMLEDRVNEFYELSYGRTFDRSKLGY